jgi:hypothetical protein
VGLIMRLPWGLIILMALVGACCLRMDLSIWTTAVLVAITGAVGWVFGEVGR